MTDSVTEENVYPELIPRFSGRLSMPTARERDLVESESLLSSSQLLSRTASLSTSSREFSFRQTWRFTRGRPTAATNNKPLGLRDRRDIRISPVLRHRSSSDSPAPDVSAAARSVKRFRADDRENRSSLLRRSPSLNLSNIRQYLSIYLTFNLLIYFSIVLLGEQERDREISFSLILSILDRVSPPIAVTARHYFIVSSIISVTATCTPCSARSNIPLRTSHFPLVSRCADLADDPLPRGEIRESAGDPGDYCTC